MGHGGRHSPHAGQFFRSHPGFYFALVLQKHDTKTLGRVVLQACQLGADFQPAKISTGAQDGDIVAMQVVAGKTLLGQFGQDFKRGIGFEVQRVSHWWHLGAQHGPRSRVG